MSESHWLSEAGVTPRPLKTFPNENIPYSYFMRKRNGWGLFPQRMLSPGLYMVATCSQIFRQMNQSENDIERVRRAVESLGEHFDTVQIFTTRHNPDGDDESGTINVQWGSGNIDARYGQIAKWILRQVFFLHPL